MNAYIAILKRDLRINGTAYLLLPLFIAIVLSTEQQLHSLYENVTIAVLLPAVLGWQHANSLKAMIANPASLLSPNGRIQQFNYSTALSIVFLVLVPLLTGIAPASILTTWLILSLSVVVLLISFSAALPETANLAGFFMSLVFVWWASDLLGVVYIADISQFVSLMALPEPVRISIASAATIWSVLMFRLFQRAYFAPKELDESRLPHSWLSRTNEKVTLWKSIGFSSPHWLSALVQNWQRRCFLVNPRSLLEKGLYGGERSTNAVTVVLICSCLVILVMTLLSIPARAQGALNSEGWLMVVGMFFTLAAFILSFNLMLEFISLQPTVVELWLLDKSPDRKTYMARVGRSFCLRVLRFYAFFALIFLLIGIAVAGSFSGIRIYFIIISFSAMILPLQIALAFYCAPRFRYRPLLINSLLAITVGIYAATMVFSKVIIPVGGLMASLTVLGGVGLALTALQYDRWCKTALELAD
ncbi:hypothetical protein [Lacimicrobium alkaliphilum]|uniref:Uncharacterized protein n=1 Tax=Lacimicrobium alkaliphilum TaxID=1526571 RepID=A0A0U3B0A5_9ALTE|nr:hypothetical protein [Lacimicrobium alkaliphilum]ALS99807.1 hypothetical protein AT746_17060 [Lacimicrobium alkaliphilum]